MGLLWTNGLLSGSSSAGVGSEVDRGGDQVVSRQDRAVGMLGVPDKGS